LLKLIAGLLFFCTAAPALLQGAPSGPDTPHPCAPGVTLELIANQGPEVAWATLADALEADPDCAWRHRDWALLSLRTGRLAEARERLEALTGQHPESAAIRFGLGLNLLYDSGAPRAPEKGRAHLEEARRLLGRDPAGGGDGEVAVCDGFCLLALSALAPTAKEAERLIGESRLRFDAGGSTAGRGLALKQLAGQHLRRGETEQALDRAGEALDCFKAEDTLDGATLALHLMGQARAALGLAGEAQASYRRSLALAETQHDGECRLRNMVALGLLARGQDAGEALDWFDRAIPVARRLDMDELLLYALTTRGTICGTELNRYRTALDSFGEALALARRTGRTVHAARCLANMGHIRSYLGDYDAALLELQDAADLLEGLESANGSLVGFVNREMGYLLWKSGAVEQARVRLHRAAGAARACNDRAGLANTLHLQGALASEAGKPGSARSILMSARKIYAEELDDYGQACVMYSMGRNDERIGAPEQAVHRYTEAARLGEEKGYPILAWNSNYRLARMALERGDLLDALACLEKALATIAESRARQVEDALRWAYMEDKHQVFCSTVDTLDRMATAGLIEDGTGRCFSVAEQAHASALLDMVVSGGVDGQLPEISAEAARTVLPDEQTVLLEYLLGEDVSFLIRLTGSEVTVHRLPPRGEIESLTTRYLELLRRHPGAVGCIPSPELLDAGRDLQVMLLGPVQQGLAPGDRLIIVADGLLHHLPFEALVLPDEGPPSFLATVFETAYAHSAAVLAELSAAPTADDPSENRLDLLAVGNPRLDISLSISPLPHSGREVRRIAGGLARARVFTGEEATKDLLLDPELARARVIHLATHALVDAATAREAAICLSRSADGSSRLRPEEIEALDLDAELVVLSTCGSGLGRPVGGEGVVGLSRAFVTAGSRSVIHTLWPVEDRFTARLMVSFYDGLARGETKTAALAEARRAALADGAHPHYWAPFVLVGDGSSTLLLEPRPWWRAWWPWVVAALFLILAAIIIRQRL